MRCCTYVHAAAGRDRRLDVRRQSSSVSKQLRDLSADHHFWAKLAWAVKGAT